MNGTMRKHLSAQNIIRIADAYAMCIAMLQSPAASDLPHLYKKMIKGIFLDTGKKHLKGGTSLSAASDELKAFRRDSRESKAIDNKFEPTNSVFEKLKNVRSFDYV